MLARSQERQSRDPWVRLKGIQQVDCGCPQTVVHRTWRLPSLLLLMMPRFNRCKDGMSHSGTDTTSTYRRSSKTWQIQRTTWLGLLWLGLLCYSVCEYQSGRSNCISHCARHRTWLSMQPTTWSWRSMALCHLLRQAMCGLPRRTVPDVDLSTACAADLQPRSVNSNTNGQPFSRIIARCQSRIGPQVRATELNEPWSTNTPSLDTMSNPVNALFTWGSLWSHSDLRVTGEVTRFLRLIACALLQKINCPTQQLFSGIGDDPAQIHWMTPIRTDSKGNTKVKRVELTHKTVQLALPPANAQRSLHQVLTSQTVLNTRRWHCNDNATDFLTELVCHLPHPDSREFAVKMSAQQESKTFTLQSLNITIAGLWLDKMRCKMKRWNFPFIFIVQHILSSHKPAVVILKDWRILDAKASARTAFKGMVKIPDLFSVWDSDAK